MLCWLDRDAKTKLLRITKKPLLSDLSRWFGRERGPLQARRMRMTLSRNYLIF